MRICCAISGFSSMLSLTMRTAPLAPRTTFSRTGPNCLHGPHHGAQKSTMTGCSNEASTTSAMKVAVLTSLTGAAAAGPPPIKVSFVMPCVLPGICCQNGGGNPARQAPRRAGSILRTAEVEDDRRVSASGDKAQQVAGRDRGGAVVFERMVVERVTFEHAAVEHHPNPVRAVVDGGDGRD